MEPTPSRKSPTRYPAQLWERIRVAACQGVPYSELSRVYGIPRPAIQNKSQAQNWETPSRREKRIAALSPKQASACIRRTADKDNVSTLSAQGRDKVNTLSSPDELLALVSAPDIDFQKGVSHHLKGLIAQSMALLEPSGAVNEAVKLIDVWRKTSGLDAKDKQAANTPLVNPLRTVSRRAVVEVEAVPVPDPDPVPEIPEDLEGWEV